MEYPELVEICGNCHVIVRWDKNGDPIHNCNEFNLQFIDKSVAVELGLLPGA